jgi:hypothetical protein
LGTTPLKQWLSMASREFLRTIFTIRNTATLAWMTRSLRRSASTRRYHRMDANELDHSDRGGRDAAVPIKLFGAIADFCFGSRRLGRTAWKKQAEVAACTQVAAIGMVGVAPGSALCGRRAEERDPQGLGKSSRKSRDAAHHAGVGCSLLRLCNRPAAKRVNVHPMRDAAWDHLTHPPNPGFGRL